MVVPIPDGGFYEKLLDTVQKAFGFFFQPNYVRRIGKAATEARRDEMLMLAQAEKDVERIKKGELVLTADGRLLPSTSKPALTKSEPGVVTELRPDEVSSSQLPPLIMLAIQQRGADDARGFQRAINIQKILLNAEEAGEQAEQSEAKVSEEPVDEDWLSRWRGFAEDVSDEQMQRLWGKVLAGEVRQPRSYSRHALNLLASMSKEDAELMARIANFDFGLAMLKLDSEDFGTLGISYGEAIYLNDIGVLNGVVGLGGVQRKFNLDEFNWNGQEKKFALISLPPVAVLVILPHTATEFALPIFSISKPAGQLMKMSTRTIDVVYLRLIAKAAKSRGAEEVRYGLATFRGDQFTIHPQNTIAL